MQELDDEAPGWFSQPLRWGSYGMLARASASADSLGLALARWCRHHGLLTRDVTLHLHTEGATASVRIEEHRDMGALREFALLSMLRNVHGLSSWWIDSGIALHTAAFPFAAPPHVEVYAALFGCPLLFDAPQAALHFDARYLAQPLRRDSAALDQMLRHALPLLVWPYRRDRLLALRVRRQLMAHAGMKAEALAAAMGLSVRSLHRQLAAEGTRLQTLKNEARLSQAQTLLVRSHQPVRQVAQAAGFMNEKSFARAFRAWTGMTPEQWRRQGAEGR